MNREKILGVLSPAAFVKLKDPVMIRLIGSCYRRSIFFSSSLLKTFSMNPFQGQYPNMAVRITTTPTNPRIHRKTPEMKKATMINITPMIDRTTPSPLPTFFTFMADFSSLNSSALKETHV
jgi:hypothetical protein